jgi:CTP:molybdopterin cytidylyltransferase MocA
MISPSNLAGIILAAGYSSRMHQFKPLLPLGKSTVIETAIDGFIEAGIGNIVVVIGHNAEALKPLLDHKKIQWVYNSRFDEGMFTSILAGLNALEKSVHGFLLLPADIPLVKKKTINQLCEAFDSSNKDIIYPVYLGRRGHPPIISAKMFPEILKYDGTGGLKALLKTYGDRAFHVEVDDEGVLLDMDQYEDYMKLCMYHS